jgi:hypothetical protein
VSEIEEHWAKEELLRLEGHIQEPVLLIGGLAVQRYSPGRKTKDIDIVCDLSQQKEILSRAYPLSDYTIEESQNDLRPGYKIVENATGRRIYLGSKIKERTPYPYLDYNILGTDAVAFKYDDKSTTKILIPNAHSLAYSKLLSFFARRGTLKGQNDLKDFVDLTNHPSFSVNGFITVVTRSGATDELNKLFTETVLTEQEQRAIQASSVLRSQSIIPLTVAQPKKTSAIADQSALALVDEITKLSQSPKGEEFGRYLEEIRDTQFQAGLFRRNWDIQISYDVSDLKSGFIKEIINWEYELINFRSYDVETELTLTHAKDVDAGRMSRFYTMLDSGVREEVVLRDQTVIEGHYWKKEAAKVTLSPGRPYFVTLYYVNVWPVHSEAPKIHNSLTSKHPCLNCRMRFVVPEGYTVSLLKRHIIEPNLIDNVFDVRFGEPLLAEQKIEYILERGPNL